MMIKKEGDETYDCLAALCYEYRCNPERRLEQEFCNHATGNGASCSGHRLSDAHIAASVSRNAEANGLGDDTSATGSGLCGRDSGIDSGEGRAVRAVLQCVGNDFVVADTSGSRCYQFKIYLLDVATYNLLEVEGCGVRASLSDSDGGGVICVLDVSIKFKGHGRI
jgi:hypothetical protein